MEITITKGTWDSLGEDERAILTRLGVKPNILKEDKRKKKKSFVLAVHAICSLCGKEHTKMWKMEERTKDNLPFFKGRLLPGDTSRILFKKVESRILPTCCFCKKELLEREKEDLVKLLISYSMECYRKKETKL